MLCQHGNNFGWDIKKLAEKNKLVIVRYEPHEVANIVSEGGGSIRDTVESINAKRIVIDSLTAYKMVFESDYRYTFNVGPMGIEDTAGPIVIDIFHTPTRLHIPITVGGNATDFFTGESNLKGCNIKLNTGYWFAIDPDDGSWDSMSETFSYNFGSLPIGNHTVYYQCTDEWDMVGQVQEDQFLIVDVDIILVLDESGSIAERTI